MTDAQEAQPDPLPSHDSSSEEERKGPSTAKYGSVDQLTHVMFENIANYLKGELTATTNDYKLLASMNAVCSSKYTEMSEVARGLTSFMKDLQQKYQDFQPYLDKIEEIDTNVTELEKTVVLLDEYSKRLEWKFKNLDKALIQQQQQ